MGRDNSPKERQSQQLERKQARRASHDRILIVSEGSKTEPLYFSEIRTAYRLHTANVEVRPSELGTAPIQVVQYALQVKEHGAGSRSMVQAMRCAACVVARQGRWQRCAPALAALRTGDMRGLLGTLMSLN